MTITLLNFSDRNNAPFKVGEVITGTVRFTAETAGNYTDIGYQVIMHCRIGDLPGVNLVSKIRVAYLVKMESNADFAAGETREYPVSFTVPNHPSYCGKLFDVRPGVRGYAVPAKPHNVVFRRRAGYYPVSEPWYYSVRISQFQIKGQVAMMPAAKGCATEALIPFAMFVSFALLGLGKHGLVAAIFCWIWLGYYSLIRQEDNFRISPPVIQLENNGEMLLARISFTTPTDKVVQLFAGYEVRERHCFTGQNGEQVIYEPVSAKEPRQKVFLNKNGHGLAEHHFLLLPPPRMWNDIGFEWTYRVSATLADESCYEWEGVIDLEVEEPQLTLSSAS